MEKLLYLIDSELAPQALREALTGPLANRLLASNSIYELEVYVMEMSESELQHMENNMDPEGWLNACVSIWVDSLDVREKIEDILKEVAGRLAAYSVTESVPREYKSRNWPDGTMSPTVTIATALPAKPGLSEQEFYARWHGSHTPLSLRIHPLTRYVRNTVSRILTDGAPIYKGFVFESVDSLETLTSVEKFYGGDANRKIAVKDLLSFTDISRMASKPMTETIVCSAAWRCR